MQLDELLFRGGLTIALGLIIGFQRERKEATLAGIRTFPLIAMLGFFCALLEHSGSSWAVAAGLIGMAILLVGGMLRNTDDKNHGLTTEAAAIFTFLMGAAFLRSEHVAIVVVAGGICALLLYLKERMHRLARALDHREVKAIMQFVLLAFIILPLLPDKSYDNFGVINPQKIWIMVVLITGISLVSFAVQKFRGAEAGALWSGILGGLISSTAATVSLSRVSARNPDRRSFVPALVIASTIALIRVLAEILIISPRIFSLVVLPLALLLAVMASLSFYAYYTASKVNTPKNLEHQGSPSELRAALLFGFMFAAILYLSAWTRENYGERGLYVVSLISGLIDVDAITLSTTQLINKGSISEDLGWRLIMVAFLSNLVFKSALVIVLARGTVRKRVTFHLLLSTVIGTAIVIFG